MRVRAMRWPSFAAVAYPRLGTALDGGAKRSCRRGLDVSKPRVTAYLNCERSDPGTVWSDLFETIEDSFGFPRVWWWYRHAGYGICRTRCTRPEQDLLALP